MAKEVNLLSYWMPVLRQLKEFKEIAKAEEPEIELLLQACERALDNFFIETADEEGLARFEKIMSIIPEAGETLDTRRFNALVKWNDNTVYTEATLENLLTSICGEGKYSLTKRYDEYVLEVSTTVSVAGAYELVSQLLETIIPCNMVVILSNTVERTVEAQLNSVVVTCSTMCYQIF